MNATRYSILGALAASLLLLSACDDEKAADAADQPGAAANKDDEADAAKADDPKEAPEAAEAGADEADADAEGGAEAAAAYPTVGVEVCDDYIEKYAQCVREHAPDNMRDKLLEAHQKNAERYKTQSEGPEKDALGEACKAALDAAKKSSKGWGCTYD